MAYKEISQVTWKLTITESRDKKDVVPASIDLDQLKMARVEGSDAKHYHFLQWALSNGIQINGVAPFRFPGRGMGIIATRTIEVS